MAATFELQAVLRLPSSPSPPRGALHRASITCRSVSPPSPPILVADGELEAVNGRERTVARIGLPSKGRMAEETLELLKACQLTVKQVNPRQYVAYIPQLSNLEVWFQRPKDIVRKLKSGDLDLGIVGLDTVTEYGQCNL